MTSLKKSSVENKSGLLPLGVAVLVYPYEPEVAKGVIFIPETVKEKTMMVETRATVVAVGPEAWKDEASPRALPGDKVLISRWSGNIVQGTADSKTYRMVNCEDIYCRIEVES